MLSPLNRLLCLRSIITYPYINIYVNTQISGEEKLHTILSKDGFVRFYLLSSFWMESMCCRVESPYGIILGYKNQIEISANTCYFILSKNDQFKINMPYSFGIYS